MIACSTRSRPTFGVEFSRRAEALTSRTVPRVQSLDPISFFVAVAIAAAISAGVFAHASRHGSRHATAWGVAAFLAAGIAVPVYFIRYWARRKPSP